MEDLFTIAKSLYKAGKLNEAIQTFQQVREARPSDAEVRLHLGNALWKARRIGEAIGEFRSAVRTDPNCWEAHIRLGNALCAQGLPEYSLETLHRALSRARLQAPQDRDVVEKFQSAIEATFEKCLRLLHEDGVSATQMCEMAMSFQRCDRADAATAAYRAVLKRFPEHPQATHMLAASSGSTVLPRAADPYIVDFFDRFADEYDAHLVTSLQYRGPQLVAQAITECASGKQLDILDAGCGTGLCGELLRPLARRLVGVDLSPGMLQRAEERKIYDHLEPAELTSYLQLCQDAFDAIAAADVLCYFGDLNPVLAAATRVLKQGGLIVFTVEARQTPEDEDAVCLRPTGRYCHTREYLTRVLASNDLELRRIDKVELRIEGDKPVDSWLVVAEAL